jgi:hypothetical protein
MSMVLFMKTFLSLFGSEGERRTPPLMCVVYAHIRKNCVKQYQTSNRFSPTLPTLSMKAEDVSACFIAHKRAAGEDETHCRHYALYRLTASW